MSRPILTLDYGDFGKSNLTDREKASRAFKNLMFNMSARYTQDKKNSKIDNEKQEEKMFYECISKIPICVLPDPRIKAINNMPYFSIMQGDFRIKNSPIKINEMTAMRGIRKSMRDIEPMLGLNTDLSLLKSIDFFKHLNTETLLKLKLKYK